MEKGVILAKIKEKQYIYIVQAQLEPSKCKIGKTNDLNRRLKEYNSITGKSKENKYQYLFTCEVKNMAEVENAIKENFIHLREETSKEIYFYNSHLFKDYVKYLRSHKMFLKEIKVAQLKRASNRQGKVEHIKISHFPVVNLNCTHTISDSASDIAQNDVNIANRIRSDPMILTGNPRALLQPAIATSVTISDA